MKKKILILAAVLPFLFMACNDDDAYSLDKFWQSIATVENPENNSAYFFMCDDSVRMWTAAPMGMTYRPKSGQRIIANYTILNDQPKGSEYDHDVRMNSVYEVLTKDIFKVTPETQDSIGNDPIEIVSMWIGSKSHFLNVEFVFHGLNKTHFVSLVSDANKTYSDGKIHLEFRHNANNDSPSYRKAGIVSFDLRSLQDPANEMKLDIVVHTNEYGSSKEKEYEFNYKYGRHMASHIPDRPIVTTNWTEVR